MFTDRTQIKLIAGRGGNGVVAWRREKYIPKGGPTGGNGGRGGDVILVADHQIPSLDQYRNNHMLRAENGRQGGANQAQGRTGTDLVLKVPCGTLVKDAETGALLYDLTESGQRVVLCQGGRGGRGNASFKTSTNRAPNRCTDGSDGEEKLVELELKLIADVGLVGFPNAGKSTLISALSRVRVRIAPYPFTTLHPNLGYIQFDDFSRILIADIPGIIGGAHQDRGLGLEFLRHIERTKVLVFVIDISAIDGRDPLEDLQVLRRELEAYDPELLSRPFLVVANKIDAEFLEVDEKLAKFRAGYDLPPESLFEVSAQEKINLDSFLEALRSLAQRDGKRFR